MRGTRGGKVPRALVAVMVMVVGGCADKPAMPPAAAAVESRTDGLTDTVRAGLVLDLQVTDGPHAGRYHVETAQGSCSRWSFGRGSWAIRYAKKGARPSMMRLTISDATAAEQATGGTGEFGLGVVFGAVARQFPGGAAVVRDDGGRATLRVYASADDGTRLEATIRCNDVVRVAGMDGR